MENKLPSIANCSELEGKYVFVRASLNVPVQDNKVVNTFRLKQSLPTIQFLIEKKARIILCSHIGRKEDESLAPVYEALRSFMDLKFSDEVLGETTTRMRNELQNGEVLLLENVRRDTREIANDASFAQELSSLADIFVNDDFATSHRAHASLHAICQYLPSYAGLNCIHEYEELSQVMTPQSPSLFILGGAKFETKMPLVEKYLTIYDRIFIGGALANDFFKAKGFDMGESLVSDISLEGSSLLDHPKILLPVDVVAVSDRGARITDPGSVAFDESVLDVGPKTIEMLASYIADAQTILWNGPMGNYERGYQAQTLACAKLIAQSRAYSVVGGGDTIAAIESLQCESQYGFLSTAGGAMLTFLEEGSLLALDALRASHR
jgi:phosphoglycerate kinase